jgi:rfaE bifunctional protein nucleotidyltransferase chain/domain
VIRQNDSGIFVYAAGVFDLLHFGHVRYLQAAKNLGNVLVVGLLSDDGVRRYKPYRPVLSYEERWEVMRALRCIDYIVRQEETDPTKTLRMLRDEHNWIFDIMVRSDDYQGIPPGTAFIKEHGGQVIRVPYCNDIIKDRIKQGWNG